MDADRVEFFCKLLSSSQPLVTYFATKLRIKSNISKPNHHPPHQSSPKLKPAMIE